MLYNSALASAIQECESAPSTHMFLPSWTSPSTPPHPTPLGCHSTRLCSLWSYSSFPLAIYFWHMVVYICYICQCYPLNLSYPLLPPLLEKMVLMNLWPPDVKSWLIGKDPDAGKDWRQEEKGVTEDELIGWHHWLSVWASSRRWWRTGKPGVWQFMGSQRVGHDWATEQQQQLMNLLQGRNKEADIENRLWKH